MDAKHIKFYTGSGTSTLLTDLIGYWKLTEPSGTNFNEEVSNYDATGSGIVASSSGVEFDSSGDYVYVPNTAGLYPSSTAFSVSLWFYLDTLPSSVGRNMFLIRFYDNSYVWSYEAFIKNSENYITFYINDSSDGDFQSETANNAVSAGQWYNLILVNQTGTYPHIYLNNSDVTSYHPDTWTGTIRQPTGDLYFGSPYSSGTSSIDGRVRSVGIWNKALSSDERTELYNNGTPNDYPF